MPVGMMRQPFFAFFDDFLHENGEICRTNPCEKYSFFHKAIDL